MNQALELAAQALFLSNPNPRVGCVLVAQDGSVIGCGFTQQVGGPHAEVMALRNAAMAGRDSRDATAYVTLEPCAHQGRTGPCCDALIAAGISKVVASIEDPNPAVAGQGFARLRAAGVDVQIGQGAAESHALNIGFFSRMVRGAPWVRLKVAASLDGTTALYNGASQWITSPDARADGHAWRARACAILTGIGTVLDDDPRLDVREVATQRQPYVVVIDSTLQTPVNALIFAANRACYIYAAVQNDEKKQALEASGATVIYLPNAHAKVDLSAMLSDLAQRGVNELHVEAGHKLNGSLLREGLVDEMLVYVAPKLLGPGLGLANIGPFDTLAEGVTLDFTSIDRIGTDLRIVSKVLGRQPF